MASKNCLQPICDPTPCAHIPFYRVEARRPFATRTKQALSQAAAGNCARKRSCCNFCRSCRCWPRHWASPAWPVKLPTRTGQRTKISFSSILFGTRAYGWACTASLPAHPLVKGLWEERSSMAGQALPWRGGGEDDLKLYFGQGLPPSVKGECSINSKDPETAPTRSKLHWFQTHQSSRPLEPSTINQAVEQPSSV